MDDRNRLSRREFTLALGGAVVGSMVGCRARPVPDDLDLFITEMLELERAPGLSAAVVIDDRLHWSGGFGLADIRGGTPMSPDTIQNIGSVSKTVTATAIMQLWEAGRFDLDDDVGRYLPFTVRNPQYPETPITFRQLLAHRSSIKDGPAYRESYACGDPAVELGVWIHQYFTPDGEYYDPDGNFHSWVPGNQSPPETPRAYTNVGYGLLGSLVEHLTGSPFDDYCRERIFSPLGMNDTGWMLTEIDPGRHAVPYSLLPDDFEIPEGSTMEEFLPADHVTEEMLVPGAHIPHCLYSFYNYPDGLLRTSVNELSSFLRAYINGGTSNGAKILEPATIDMMLSDAHFGRGLCWFCSELPNGDHIWGHGGGDPGIATYMGFRQRDRVGVLLFFNCGNRGEGSQKILERLFEMGGSATGV